MQQIVTVSDRPGGGSVVFGEVQRIHIHNEIYQDDYILLEAYKPIGRLGGQNYVRMTDTFEMQRPTVLRKA